MTETDLTAIAQQSSVPTKKNGTPLKITRKVRAAIDLMVWQGLKRNDAAHKAGIKDNSLYVALRRPDVKAYYLGELDVLRTSERARNIHTAVAVREQTDNQAARMQAVRWLEEVADAQRTVTGQRVTTPGVTVVINTTRDRSHVDNTVIELNPSGVLNGDGEQGDAGSTT